MTAPAPLDLADRLEALAAKATPGPWFTDGGALWVENVHDTRQQVCCGCPLPSGECCANPVEDGAYAPTQEQIGSASAEDAPLIAETINALPTIIAALRDGQDQGAYVATSDAPRQDAVEAGEEPTPEMLLAARLEEWPREDMHGDLSETDKARAAADIYRAMVAARPTKTPSLHPATAMLVQRFAAALAEKLAAAEAKYGHTDGWLNANWQADCIEAMHKHMQKGDPRDVAAYCAFAWHHGWSTNPSRLSSPPAEGLAREASPQLRDYEDTPSPLKILERAALRQAPAPPGREEIEAVVDHPDASKHISDAEDPNLYWNLVRDDPALARARQKLSMHELRRILQHANTAAAFSALSVDRGVVERLSHLLLQANEPCPKPMPEQDTRAAEAMASHADDEARKAWMSRVKAARGQVIELLPTIISLLTRGDGRG